MGLFDFLRKDPQGAKKPRRGKRPGTYEELVKDLLNNRDRSLLYEDCRMLSGVFTSVGQLSDRFDMMSAILEKTVEVPRDPVNYEFVIEHLLEQYRMYLGERDATYVVPWDKQERLNDAIVNLYQQSGPEGQKRLEYNTTTIYNIPYCALRKLICLLMENGEKREEILGHMSPVKTEGGLFCLLDFIRIHMDDPDDALRKEIRDYIRKNLHTIVLCNTGEVIPDNRVSDVPEFIRRIYLPVIRCTDKELLDRFNELWKA